MERRFSSLDRCLIQLQQTIRTLGAPAPPAVRPYPARNVAEARLSEPERRHAAGLMRVNHAGEVCAQALYSGQTLSARHASTKTQLQAAAREETDHLSWCRQRLDELGSRTSYSDPLWYAASFGLGALAGLAGDRFSLGFVVETERQVEAHLGEHINRLPLQDERSRTVVRQMQSDEARHGQGAKASGGRDLPWPVPTVMRSCANVMKFVAYRV